MRKSLKALIGPAILVVAGFLMGQPTLVVSGVTAVTAAVTQGE